MTFVSGWRLALRLAWREAVRSKARSALVLFMVTFPVVAVVAADVAQATSSVSAVEGLDRRMGSSEALVSSEPDGGRIVQAPDPGNGTSSSGHGPAPTLPDVLDALGGRRPATEFRTGGLIVRTSVGALAVHAVGVDLANPLAHGLFRLTRGRLATAPDEIDINQALVSEGFAIGDTVRARGGRTLAVVGIAESTDVRTPPVVMGLPDSVTTYRPATGRTWLVGGAPVTWSQVGAVNEIGATVLSREVINHPPATTALPPEVLRAYATDRTQVYTILALIGVMALTEVVLLAGPAFAVGARRQSRTLALIGANGGTPVQSRRMILAMAVVLGSLGAVVGFTARHRGRPGSGPPAAGAGGQLVRPLPGPVDPCPGHRGLRLAQRLAGSPRARLGGLAAGRRRGARRAPGRPQAEPTLSPDRPRADRGRCAPRCPRCGPRSG